MHYMACKSGEIKDTGTAKGSGIFAVRPIASGETIEICPVVVLHSHWGEMPDEIKRVVFDWGYLTKGARASCIALGWGSMYNHANPANVRYAASGDSQLMVFSAARDIAAGEELTVNYNETGGDIYSSEDVWFQDTGIEPI